MKITELTREDYEEIEVNSSRWLSLDNLKNEYWKDIKDFEGLYQVSNYGRVKSLKRKTRNNQCMSDIILKQSKIKQGYYQVTLCKEHKKYMRLVHMLVAKAFIPNPLNKPCVDHDKPVEKDCCNNCVYNLRWATHKENTQHCWELNRNRSPMYNKFGKDNHNSKPIIQYDLHGIFIRQWYSMADIERELGFCYQGISANVRNKKHSAYGYKWKYGLYKKER